MNFTMNTNSQKIIDGIKCYAPELARENNDFKESSFKELYKLEEKNFWFRSRNRVIESLVKKYFGSDSNGGFLEIGCGTGFVLKGLEKNINLKLFGAEIYLEGLKYAKMRLPNVEFIQLNAIHLPFDNQFECVGAFDVLEHIQEDELVIQGVFKSLKKDGYFFVSVPQYMFMWSYLDDVANHKRRYSKKEIIDKLSNSGFKVLFASSYVFSLFPLMMVSRFLKKGEKIDGIRNKDTFKELRINKYINKLFEYIMYIDEFLIKNGLQLPFGGSLFIVAVKQ